MTIARAIELKHSSSLIAALCAESARSFQSAAGSLKALEAGRFGKWSKYLELKCLFYQAYVRRLGHSSSVAGFAFKVISGI